VSRYLYLRGKGSKRRVMHLTTFYFTTGAPTFQPLCGRVSLPFNTTSNVPWGRPVCKRCIAADTPTEET
jgi:hypothetical protein